MWTDISGFLPSYNVSKPTEHCTITHIFSHARPSHLDSGQEHHFLECKIVTQRQIMEQRTSEISGLIYPTLEIMLKEILNYKSAVLIRVLCSVRGKIFQTSLTEEEEWAKTARLRKQSSLHSLRRSCRRRCRRLRALCLLPRRRKRAITWGFFKVEPPPCSLTRLASCLDPTDMPDFIHSLFYSRPHPASYFTPNHQRAGRARGACYVCAACSP